MRAAVLGVVAAIAIAVAAALWLQFSRAQFLAPYPGAEWIMFDGAVDLTAHPTVSLDAEFVREFTVPVPPRSAELTIRAMKRAVLRINGNICSLPGASNWKHATRVEVAPLLRAGTNRIDVRVFDDSGPPALWLVLRGENLQIRTDAEWRASFAGSASLPVHIANNPRVSQPGNAGYSDDDTLIALRSVWKAWLLFTALALLLLFGRKYARPFVRPSTFVVLVAVMWLGLWWNNSRFLPLPTGFDAQAHLDYINFIQQRGALPLPKDGVEMFQPPLYYAIGAGSLSLLHLNTTQPAGLSGLRLLAALIAIAQAAVVFASVRLLWPRDATAQLIGTTTAVFLPMHLYLSQYFTNETLGALLSSTAILLCLRALRRGSISWRDVALLGLTSGAAGLTKVTGLLIAVVIAGALLMAMWRGVERPFLATMKVVAFSAITLALCGWHYVRIAHASGSFVIGGWDPASGFHWWQEDGYRVANWFLRFGASLRHPYFSASQSFADGLYSTAFGDGMCGGVSAIAARVPWNYQLMTAGYLLAVVPATLIAVGFISAILRKRTQPWLLLIAIAVVLAAALVCVNCSVPAYASVKAFYGLGALVPIAGFAALGWRVLPRPMRLVFAVAIGVFALNSVASIGVRNSAAQHLYVALRSASHDATRATREARDALELEPTNSTALRLLAALRDEQHDLAGALDAAHRAVEANPADGTARVQFAAVLAENGDTVLAIRELRRAIELAPESLDAHRLLASIYLRSGTTKEAQDIARDGLAISAFDSELHGILASASMSSGAYAVAANQFAYTLMLQPASAEMRSALDAALASALRDDTQRRELEATAADSPILLASMSWQLASDAAAEPADIAAAVELSGRACELVHDANANVVAANAFALCTAGDFARATARAEHALTLARQSDNSDARDVAQRVLAAAAERRQPIAP